MKPGWSRTTIPATCALILGATLTYFATYSNNKTNSAVSGNSDSIDSVSHQTQSTRNRTHSTFSDSLENSLERVSYKDEFERAFKLSSFDQAGILSELFRDLEDDNLSDALSAFEEIENAINQRNALPFLITAWARFKPADAVSYALDERWDSARQSAAAAAFEIWSQSNPYEALSWFSRNEIEDERFIIRAGIVSGWMKVRPMEAEAFILSQDHIAPILVAQVPQHYLNESPNLAKEWIASIENTVYREIALDVTSRMWAKLDLTGAANWISSISSEPDTSTAIGNIAKSMSAEDPELAAAWLSGLHPEANRTEGIIATFAHWKNRDLNAASAWIATIQEEGTGNRLSQDPNTSP